MYRITEEKGNRRRGFTTIELLVVLAILAIAFALAIPSLAQMRQGLSLMELDGTAREIFLSVQNNLTGLKASRRLADLSLGGGLQEEAGDPSGKILYYVISEDIETLLGADSGISGLMGTLPGESVVYLNPVTGDVTDVYYAIPALTYSDVKRLRDELGGHDDRRRRAQMGIGYYGGLAQSSTSPGEELPPQGKDSLTLINKEDLYFTLAYPAVGKDAFTNPQKVLAEIRLEDEHSNTFVIQADGEGARDDRLKAAVFAETGTDNSYSLEIVLDSMAPGLSFMELFPGLMTGDDITVTASLFYDGKVLYRNAPAGTQNSLFAAKYPADITSGGLLHRQGVEFAYVRHLSNLRHYRQDNTSAVQTADLDFAILAKLRSGTEEAQHRDWMLPRAEHRAGMPEFFSPVDIAALGLTVDGKLGTNQAFTLKNFKINSGISGLFGSITTPITLQNLSLVDCTVTGSQAAGSLAGSINVIQASTIRNCGAYQTARGRGFVAGANQAAGGLIGYAQGPVSISQCFGAVNVTAGNTYAGGLIGQAVRVSQIKNCYASGEVQAAGSGSFAGGLVGGSLSTAIEFSFSSSNVAGNTAGGLVGVDFSGSGAPTAFKDSYACGIVRKSAGQTYGPLAGSGNPVYTDVRYLSQSGNTTVENAYGGPPALPLPSGVTAYEYDELARGVSNDWRKSHPYAAALQGKAYPFAMVTSEYYGDWPERFEPGEPTFVNGKAYGLSYYEKYTDGSWGFYSFDEDGALLDSLDYDNTKTIDLYGYAVAVAAGKSDVKSPSIEGWSHTTLDPPIYLADRDLDIYPIANAGNLATHINQASRKIQDNETEREFYFNPFFGATLSPDQILANEDTPVHIRTEEHLAARNRIGDAWYFKQTHDIIITGASFEIAGQTVSAGGFSNNTAGAVYDGGGNTIYNIQKPLFTTNNNGAIIKNLSITGIDIINSTQNPAGALLANNNGGLVENCHVLSGSITSQGGNVAGFAGQNGGAIKNCSVKNMTVSSVNGYAAGFVGMMQGSQGAIEDAKVEHTVVTSENGNAAGFAIENQRAIKGGRVANTTITASESGYATGFVGQTSGTIEASGVENATVTAGRGHAAGFVYRNVGITSDCSAHADVVSESGHAAGFAYIQEWSGKRIKDCRASGTVLAKGIDRYAAGFIIDNLYSNNVISDSQAASVVRAPKGYASGFVDRNNGADILACTAAVDVQGADSARTYPFYRSLTGGIISLAPPP